jgi:hypothetical protein
MTNIELKQSTIHQDTGNTQTMKIQKYENWQTPTAYAASYEVAENESVVPYEVAQEIEASLTKQIVELKKELSQKVLTPSQVEILKRTQDFLQQQTPMDAQAMQLLARLRRNLAPKTN